MDGDIPQNNAPRDSRRSPGGISTITFELFAGPPFTGDGRVLQNLVEIVYKKTIH